jgi:hypothetical protein
MEGLAAASFRPDFNTGAYVQPNLDTRPNADDQAILGAEGSGLLKLPGITERA